MLTQDNAPIYEKLREYLNARVTRFDVPGHKGRGNKELTLLLGESCLKADVNSMKPLDNLTHPISVIKDAQLLAAEAFGASNAFFIVGGASAAVQVMVMSVCKAGDKIILPRNVHRSVINALVICGAIPVYINPGVNHELGIPLGINYEDCQKAIHNNPDAKAVLVNNPTYYGICSNLQAITELAHANNMRVLVDEAHGTHFYFGEEMPVSAMAAQADMAAVSMHKTGGSLTQSAILLAGKHVNADYIRQVLNLTLTTSASYLLLSSLDLARKDLSLNGKENIRKTKDMAHYARVEINRLGGYNAFGRELTDGSCVYDFDDTKLSVHTRNIGLAGIEVYDILRDEYEIQIEFGDIGNILAIISAGDTTLELERLISALSEIKRNYAKDKAGMFAHEYITPEIALTPQEAFYSKKIKKAIGNSHGEIAAEFVMCYPPGIPILAPGERITQQIIDYILYAKEKGCLLTGPQDININHIQVVR